MNVFMTEELRNNEDLESLDYNEEFKKVKHSSYAFMEIPVMKDSGHVGKSTVQSAAITVLLESIYKGAPCYLLYEYFVL